MYNLPVFHNERDIEIPLLLQWLQKNDCIKATVLDVGCAYAFYTEIAKGLCGTLDGIDNIRQEEIVRHLDTFYQADILYKDLPMYDYVFSVSTIEHIGVEYSRTKMYRLWQQEAFAKMLNTTKKGLFLTFPYGEDDLFAGFYYNGNRRLLNDYIKLARGCKIKLKFLSATDPKDPGSWQEISQDQADKATNFLSGSVYTICVMEVYK